MKWRGVGQSDVGRRRKKNEDALFVDDELGLYIVSDGMGGHAAGEVASEEAIRSVVAFAREHASDIKSSSEVVELLDEAIRIACGDVYRLARSDVRKAGMGCTLTAVWCRGDSVAVGHVGDSRCYLLRNGSASQITSDHTIGAEMKKAGLGEVNSSFAGMLSRAIGTHETVKVDAFAIDALLGDRFLLCSDGLSNYVTTPEWLAGELEGDALDATVEGLLSYANEQGGKDNITALIVDADVEEAEREQQVVRHAAVSGHLRALSQVFLFQDLSVGLLSRLLTHCELTTHEDGDVVACQGDESAQLFVVTSGQFMLQRNGETLGVLTPGQFTAETTLLKPRPARATLIADGAGRVLRLERASFWRLVKERPWLGVNLLERLVLHLSGQLDDSVRRRDDGDDATSRLSLYQMM